MQKERIFSLTDRAAAKAMKDSTFRAALVKDANAAIKNEFYEELPLKVTFHEFSDNKLVFVIPNKPKEGVLSDDALSSVSGGLSGVSVQGNFASTDYGCFPDYISSKLSNENVNGGFSISF